MTLDETIRSITLSHSDIKRMEERDWYRDKKESEVLDKQFSAVFEDVEEDPTWEDNERIL